MGNLTSERVNGIKTGYWSPFTKEVICQKLGVIEHGISRALSRICDECCRWTGELSVEDLEEKCAACACVEIDDMISGKNPD